MVFVVVLVQLLRVLVKPFNSKIKLCICKKEACGGCGVIFLKQNNFMMCIDGFGSGWGWLFG